MAVAVPAGPLTYNNDEQRIVVPCSPFFVDDRVAGVRAAETVVDVAP